MAAEIEVSILKPSWTSCHYDPPQQCQCATPYGPKVITGSTASNACSCDICVVLHFLIFIINLLF